MCLVTPTTTFATCLTCHSCLLFSIFNIFCWSFMELFVTILGQHLALFWLVTCYGSCSSSTGIGVWYDSLVTWLNNDFLKNRNWHVLESAGVLKHKDILCWIYGPFSSGRSEWVTPAVTEALSLNRRSEYGVWAAPNTDDSWWTWETSKKRKKKTRLALLQEKTYMKRCLIYPVFRHGIMTDLMIHCWDTVWSDCH